MKLYEFNAAIEDAFERAIDAETGEIIDEKALSELEALQLGRDEKIEGVILWKKDLEADALKIRVEEITLAKRRHSAERKAELLKSFVEYALNGEKFKTTKCEVSYRKSTAVEIADGVVVDDKYMRIEKEPNKTALKEALKSGEVIEGVSLVERINMTIK